jgi:NAD(P)-dependent dehydrogenase (short-subunit alcohol dehydrogenase family)
MAVAVVTGAASGIGAAIRTRLEKDGFQVIGVDLRDAEIVADLSAPEGRRSAVAGVLIDSSPAPGWAPTCAPRRWWRRSTTSAPWM